MYRIAGKTPQFPDVKGAEFLINHLNNMGWSRAGAMGIVPITFEEIRAYKEVTNSSFSGEEAILLYKMSENFVRYAQNRDPSVKAPYCK